MMLNIAARDMMVTNLITLSAEMSVMDAIDVLLRHRISGAPVVDREDQFLGTFSEKSCMQFIVDATCDELPAGALMSFVDTHPPVITEETELMIIAQTFLDEACRRLPVLDDRGRLCGQISRRDVMRAVRQQIRSTEPCAAGAGFYLTAIFEEA